MKHLFFIIFGFLAFFNFSLSKDFTIQIDDAYFYDLDSNKYRWELYYSFEDKELKFVKRDDYYLGELYMDVSIISQKDVLLRKRWIVSHKINEIKQDLPLTLIGEKDFYIEPGEYTISIYVQDFYDSTNYSDISFDINIPNQEDKKIFQSNLELSSMVTSVKTSQIKWNNAFIKDSVYVVPVPSRLFDAQKQSLYSYFEIYQFIKTSVKYNVQYELVNTYNEVVFTNNKEFEGSNSKIVFTNNIPLFSLPGGKYFFNVKVTNSINMLDTLNLNKEVYIINLEKLSTNRRRLVENQSFENSEFSTLTPKQTDIELRKIRAIATEEELDKIDLLTKTIAKQRMLYNFWKIRDNDTTDNFNESLFNFKKLIKYTEENFSYGNVPGWETDRGRIVLKYGIPGQRLFNPQKGDFNAYETWFYEGIQGGVYFYFVDVTGYGNFILVHSTAYGEIQFEDWYNEYVVKNNRYHFNIDDNRR